MRCFLFVPVVFLGCAGLVCSALATDILTNRGDNARTGLNANETVLTPSIVTSSSFGLVYNNPVDGQVYAQPLYVSNQLIIVNGQSQGTHNVLYVATEHDSLCAFDADTGVLYWKTSLLPTGESPVQANDPNINCSDLVPEIGITATPVIDKSAGSNGTIFVVAFSTNGSGGYFNRLHAIDLATGHDQLGIGPVLINPAPVIGTSPFNTFNSTNQRGRAGLLLLNGIIYTSWGSYCDTSLLEKYPGVKARVITDNSPQFVARDFKEFIRIAGLTHVKTSPYYPQSYGKIERWHQTLKADCLRPGCPLSIEDARGLVERFVTHYNTVRLHSAIGYISPADRLAGRHREIFAAGDKKLEAARQNREFKRHAAWRMISTSASVIE
jgi:hypothetical protein